MGTAALVIGAISLVLALLVIFAILSFPLGIIAIILGAIGMSRASRGEADNRTQAVAGLVMGVLSILLALVLGIGFVRFLTDHQSDFRKFSSCISNADNDRQRAPCVSELGNKLEEAVDE